MSDAKWDRVLIDLRNGDDMERAIAACETLERISDRSRIPDLYELLEDPSFFVREAAAVPLAQLEGLRALPVLFRALTRGEAEGHDNDGLASTVVELLEEHAVAAGPMLLAMLDSANCEERAHAAWGLGFTAEHVPVEPLLRALRHDPDPRTRGCAAGSLPSFPSARRVYEALVEALTDTDEYVRVDAISSLGYLGDPRAIEVLRSLASTASPSECRMIDHALKTLARPATNGGSRSES